MTYSPVRKFVTSEGDMALGSPKQRAPKMTFFLLADETYVTIVTEFFLALIHPLQFKT
jgi:hypothetical protein